MKTTKVILSIALLALASTLFAQFTNIKGKRLHKQKPQVAYFTADFKKDNSRIENWMYDLRTWAQKKVQKTNYVAPEVTWSVTVAHAELIYENEIRTESWMTAPFELTLTESELCLEAWMTTPFDTDLLESELCLEAWMTTPFDTDLLESELCLEVWMTTPFNMPTPEENQIIESWMITPFELAEIIHFEEWMR